MWIVVIHAEQLRLPFTFESLKAKAERVTPCFPPSIFGK